MDLPILGAEMNRLDEVLRPFAQAPVDVTDPDWLAKLRRAPAVIDRAGVRTEATVLLFGLLEAYATDGEETRVAIRELFERHPSFRWAVRLPDDGETAAGFRTHLLHLSARDQVPDTRDELPLLWDLCARARRAGVDVAPVLREVAALSSQVDRYGFGSTRDILLNCLRR